MGCPAIKYNSEQPQLSFVKGGLFEAKNCTKPYRFGFNGKEKDLEGMGGGGTTYDYGFRIYNPNLGRFLSVDPLFKSYPWYTPYQFAGNKPVWCVDIDGLEEYYFQKKIQNSFAGKLIISMLNESETFKQFASDLKENKNGVVVIIQTFRFKDQLGNVNLSFDKDGFESYKDGETSSKGTTVILPDYNTYRVMIGSVPEANEFQRKYFTWAKRQFENGKEILLISVHEHFFFPFAHLTDEASTHLKEGLVEFFVRQAISMPQASFDEKLTNFLKGTIINTSEIIIHELEAHGRKYLKSKTYEQNTNKEHKEYHGWDSRYSPGYKEYLENKKEFSGTKFSKVLNELEDIWNRNHVVGETKGNKKR